MTTPKLRLVKPTELAQLDPDAAVIFLGYDDNIKISLEENTDYYKFEFISGSPDDTEGADLARLCTLEQVEEILDLAELYRDATIYLTDDSDLSKAWVVCLGLKAYFKENLKQAIYNLVEQHPTVYIDEDLWVIDLLDLAIKWQGDLIQLVEDYVATKIVVSPYGQVAKGR